MAGAFRRARKARLFFAGQRTTRPPTLTTDLAAQDRHRGAFKLSTVRIFPVRQSKSYDRGDLKFGSKYYEACPVQGSRNKVTIGARFMIFWPNMGTTEGTSKKMFGISPTAKKSQTSKKNELHTREKACACKSAADSPKKAMDWVKTRRGQVSSYYYGTMRPHKQNAAAVNRLSFF